MDFWSLGKLGPANVELWIVGMLEAANVELWKSGILEWCNYKNIKAAPHMPMRKDNPGHRVLEGVPYKYASNYC